MSGLLAAVEKGVVDAVSAWGQSSALGREEQAVVAGILKLVAQPSVLNAVPVIEEILAIISTLKAQIEPPVSDGSTVISHTAEPS